MVAGWSGSKGGSAGSSALPRVLISLLELYQQSDGSVIVPDVLRSYMVGIERMTS
jgi:seryl-tRNA synthetase